MTTVEPGLLHQWSDFFVAEAGASAALAGLLFVVVSINLGRILQYAHLPTRAIEALATILAVLVMSTWALVPGQSLFAFGLEVVFTGAALWMIQLLGLWRTRHSGYERAVRFFFNQAPPVPFIVAGLLICLGRPDGIYWMVPGTLLCVLSSVYSAWILQVEIQR